MLSLHSVYRLHDGKREPAPREREEEARHSALLCQGNLHPDRPVKLYRAARPGDDALLGSTWNYSPTYGRDDWCAEFVVVGSVSPSGAAR